VQPNHHSVGYRFSEISEMHRLLISFLGIDKGFGNDIKLWNHKCAPNWHFCRKNTKRVHSRRSYLFKAERSNNRLADQERSI
jgi:hypothetical protein